MWQTNQCIKLLDSLLYMWRVPIPVQIIKRVYLMGHTHIWPDTCVLTYIRKTFSYCTGQDQTLNLPICQQPYFPTDLWTFAPNQCQATHLKNSAKFSRSIKLRSTMIMIFRSNWSRTTCTSQSNNELWSAQILILRKEINHVPPPLHLAFLPILLGFLLFRNDDEILKLGEYLSKTLHTVHEVQMTILIFREDVLNFPGH